MRVVRPAHEAVTFTYPVIPAIRTPDEEMVATVVLSTDHVAEHSFPVPFSKTAALSWAPLPGERASGRPVILSSVTVGPPGVWPGEAGEAPPQAVASATTGTTHARMHLRALMAHHRRS